MDNSDELKKAKTVTVMVDEDLFDAVRQLASGLAEGNSHPMVTLLSVAAMCHAKWLDVNCVKVVDDDGDQMLVMGRGDRSELDMVKAEVMSHVDDDTELPEPIHVKTKKKKVH